MISKDGKSFQYLSLLCDIILGSPVTIMNFYIFMNEVGFECLLSNLFFYLEVRNIVKSPVQVITEQGLVIRVGQ